MSEDLLDTRAAAEHLGVAATTLVKMRARRKGPRYCRVTGSKYGPIRYAPADLDAYVATNIIEPEHLSPLESAA